MAALAAGLGGLGGALKIGGTLLSFVGQMQAASAAKKTAEYEAKQQEQQAQTERAASQRKAIDERRRKDYAVSRARAVGAGGGGGLDYDVISDIEEEGEYRALTQIWGGEERARGREMQADSTRYSAQQRAKGMMIGAGTSLLQGFSSFNEKYA